MLLLEPTFSEPMLLGVVMGAQADAPAVGGLEGGAAIGAAAHMGAFDGEPLAARDRTMMPAYPCAVSRACAWQAS